MPTEQAAAQTGFFRFQKPILGLLILLLVGGSFAYRSIQVSLFPERTFPKIKIIADAGEQPVELMMVAITQPLENAVNQVEGVEMVRSTTSRGSSELSIYLNWGVDMDVSLQRVNARINQVQNTLLPNTVLSVEKMSPSIFPVMDFALASKSRDLIELRKLATYTIRPYLSRVAGVSNVQVMGGRTKEYWIVLQPDKLASLNVTPAAITTALGNTNFIQSDGLVSDYHRLYLTLTDATVHSRQDVENIIIRSDGQRVLRLADVASVELHEQQEYTRVEANGKETVLINVVKQPSANLHQPERRRHSESKGVEEPAARRCHVNADLRAGRLCQRRGPKRNRQYFYRPDPGHYRHQLIPAVDESQYRHSYHHSHHPGGVNPGSVCDGLHARHYDAGRYCGGHRPDYRRCRRDCRADSPGGREQVGKSTVETIQQAISYLFPAMVGSSLSTIVIFIPFSLMSGVAGAFFKVLAMTMVVTLTCSFLITWLGLPVIYSLFGSKKKKQEDAATHPAIGKVLSVFIHRPWIALGLAGAMAAAVLLIYGQLETGFLPEMDEGSIVLDYHSEPGTSLAETNVMLTGVDQQLKTIPESSGLFAADGCPNGLFRYRTQWRRLPDFAQKRPQPVHQQSHRRLAGKD